jgi:hypothetical protein
VPRENVLVAIRQFSRTPLARRETPQNGTVATGRSEGYCSRRAVESCYYQGWPPTFNSIIIMMWNITVPYTFNFSLEMHNKPWPLINILCLHEVKFLKQHISFSYPSIYRSIHGSTVLLLNLGRFFSSLILYTVGRTLCSGDQPVARPLLTQRTTQRINAHRYPCLEWNSNLRSQRSNERIQIMP